MQLAEMPSSADGTPIATPFPMYENPKVNTAINAIINATSDWTETDWRDLALAAVDQAGFPIRTQDRVRALLPKSIDDIARTLRLGGGA